MDTSDKISKLKGKGAKKALSIGEINTIVQMDIDKYLELLDSHKYFVFSFDTRGMNIADIMKLKWENVKNNHIHYIKSKTKDNFQIKILSRVQSILETVGKLCCSAQFCQLPQTKRSGNRYHQ